MFLKDLDKESQKILFLELAALIMMAEGNKLTTSEKIKKLEPRTKRYAVIPKLDSEIKKYKCFHTLDSESKKYLFLQNIDENEINALETYAKELEIKCIDFQSFLYSRKNMIEIMSSQKEFELMNVLEKETISVLDKYDQLDELKKEIILSNFLNSEEAAEDFILTMLIVENYILKRTAGELISIRQKNIGHLNSKEKKILLFELVGAGHSSGYFEDREKSLLLHICKLLDIESDYIDEFVEVSERLFKINAEIENLIDE